MPSKTSAYIRQYGFVELVMVADGGGTNADFCRKNILNLNSPLRARCAGGANDNYACPATTSSGMLKD
jgi:hypothetical protein